MGTSSAASKSPNRTPSPNNDSSSDSKQVDSAVKLEASSNADATKPFAPPPRPAQPQATNTPDYFSSQLGGGSLSLEPNPFEQSFGGGGAPETPGGTKLPPVATLTSPSSLLPGSGATPFNWGGGSLRTGPLSPAMLSAPTTDYFSEAHHFKGGFPTPNESSLRTGLTPGGSGSMFPAPSPNSQALFAQLASGGATPNTLDFHRTALSAAAKQSTTQQPITSNPQELPNGIAKEDAKPASGPFDPHDNDAANGLFMLAQGRNVPQPGVQFVATTQPPVRAHPAPIHPQQVNTSPQINGGTSIGSGSARGHSEAGSAMSDESEPPRPNTRAKGKKGGQVAAAATSRRRKAEELSAKVPAQKKSKTVAAAIMDEPDMSSEDEKMIKDEDGGSKSKMTDEEKRKNFLERNRVAALKCRQRKKQWLANLQTKVEVVGNENDNLIAQVSAMREEIVSLKTLLLAHKDCPITQQQGIAPAFGQVVESFNAQMNPYGMAAQLPNQQLMTGQARRFS